MSNIYEILEEVKSTSSTNEKEEILVKNKENELLKAVLVAAYNPANYYMKKVPSFQTNDREYFNLIDFIDALLPKLEKRTISGNKALTIVSEFLSEMSEEESEIASNILRKDLDIGIGAKTINKVFGKVIRENPYMRCNTFSMKRFQKFGLPFYSEEKMDGLFCNLIAFPDGKVEFISRNGKPIKSLLKTPPTNLIDEVNSIMRVFPIETPQVFMGELLIKNSDGSWRTREDSNGKLNGKELEKEDSRNVSLVAWDIIPYENFLEGEYNVSREERLEYLNDLIRDNGLKFLELVSLKVCDTLEDAIAHFDEVVGRGGEGVIVKDSTGIWKNGTPSYSSLKLKIEADLDLVVKEVLDGHPHSKWEGKAARFLCESSDGKVQVKVGSGFSDKFRKELNENRESYEGRVCTVRCFGLQKAEGSETYSLYLPRLIEMRSDKDGIEDADSLEKIKEEIELAKKFTK